jgi:hypothetical protein
MPDRLTSVMVDSELLALAKGKGMTLKSILDKALRTELEKLDKELENAKDWIDMEVKCDVCHKPCRGGFTCESPNNRIGLRGEVGDDGKMKVVDRGRCMIICPTCHEDFPMHKCWHSEGDKTSPIHTHHKFNLDEGKPPKVTPE